MAGFLVAVLWLTACGPDQGAGETAETPDQGATQVLGDGLLAAHGLEGLSGEEIVDELDSDPRPRPLPVAASVFADEVVVMDQENEVSVPIDGDLFYVSFAPFQTFTHPCTYHALGGCQGEMVEEAFDVRITTTDGDVLFDEQATSWVNGFVGVWLPRDVHATLDVSHADGTSGSVPISTFDGDPTCITTIELT